MPLGVPVGLAMSGQGSFLGGMQGGNDLKTQLAARLRVCILGGTSFLYSESESFVKVFAQEVDNRFRGEGVIFITCGNKGIQEAFATSCGDGTLVRNLLVSREPNAFRAGKDFVAGRNADEVKKFFLEMGDVYITVEGGPGVAQDARKVMARNASVLALKRTGGASAGKFDFPEKALRPDFATQEEWDLLCNTGTSVETAAKIAADLLGKLLEVKGRASVAPVNLEMSSFDSSVLSWPSTSTMTVMAHGNTRRKWTMAVCIVILLALVLIVIAAVIYLQDSSKKESSNTEERPNLIFVF